MAVTDTPFFLRWYKVGIFNLLLVAFIGMVLRYKILASLPWLNHKNFLHGHSHFAFAGWISLVLMVGIVQFIHASGQSQILKTAGRLFWAQVFTAYGMLLTFPLQGYAPISITFSTLSILVSYVFTYWIWKYCNASIWGRAASLAIRASLIFLVISSLGAFWLASLMATHSGSQNLYFTALYFFLHFQYNGWFFFGIAGLWLGLPALREINAQKGIHRGLSWLAIACLPAVLLSGLWMKVPVWIYAIAVAAALGQVIGLVQIFRSSNSMLPAFVQKISRTEKWLYGLSAVAFLLRIALQAFSTIPALSKFAFAYRPVVIGYLHLILLGCITLFLLGFIFGKGMWHAMRSLANAGITLFISGIMVTEGTLMLQGFGYIGWISIPYTNEILFAAALMMFSGILLVFISTKSKVPEKLPAN